MEAIEPEYFEANTSMIVFKKDDDAKLFLGYWEAYETAW